LKPAPWRMAFTGLGLRIYLAGVVQILLVAGAFAILHDSVLHAPWKSGGKHVSTYILSELAQQVDHPAELAAALKRVDDRLGAAVALYSNDGKLLTTNDANPPPFPGPDVMPRLDLSEVPVRASDHVTVFVNLKDVGTRAAYGSMRLPPPSARGWIHPNLLLAALALASLALTSWALARTLAPPLARLASVARDFGAGNLQARARFRRRDELGEVAGAFDEMAERIGHLVRAQKELLANVSHELRTPLSRIRVALDIAEEGNDEAAREALGGIAEDLRELERLVEDVLTTARLDLAGGRGGEPTLPLRAEPVAAGDLLDKAVSRFRAAHPAHLLVDERASDLPVVVADAQLLRRALDNLLDNAGKYSPPGSQVTLRTACRGDRLEVEVLDQGRGIEPEDLPNLFTPFFRAERSRNRATGGVGLGLTLARRILDAHGGTLEVRSEQGKGTRAALGLPLAR
jgi:two-component system OmpR family sensor kinase